MADENQVDPKAAKPVKGKGKKPEDKLGKYPKDVDVPILGERRYLWVLRVFAVALGVSMSLNLALAFTVAAVFPMKRVEPYLVTFKEKNQQLVHVMPIQRNKEGFQIMTEGLIRQYMTLTEEIYPNQAAMNKKWGRGSFVAENSAPEVYQRFYTRALPALEEFLDRGWSRSVKLNSLEEVAPGFWNIDYETMVYDDQGEPLTQEPERWIASMTVAFLPRQVTYDRSLVNPFGFTVTAFGVRPKKN